MILLSNYARSYYSLVLVWRVPLAQVLRCPRLIFPSKNLVFWNLFEFSILKITSKINISHFLNPNKSYQINSIKSCSSRSSQSHQKHISNSSEIFSYDLNLIFSLNIIQYSRTFALPSPNVIKCHGTKAHAPLLIESFPKIP
jgi:hypothetical protein